MKFPPVGVPSSFVCIWMLLVVSAAGYYTWGSCGIVVLLVFPEGRAIALKVSFSPTGEELPSSWLGRSLSLCFVF